MNPLKKLVAWWRGGPETVEEQRERERRQTIRISQNTTGKGAGGSLLNAPTPDLLEPGEHHDSR